MNPKFAFNPSDAVAFTAVGAGLGLGARGLRHMWDIHQNRDTGSPVNLPPVPSARVKMPVDVSEEEAKELEANGVPVRKEAGFGDNMLLTAGLAMPAAYGGWKLLDNHFDSQRREAATKRLESARTRVQGLLEDRPMPEDTHLHGTMKAAEDAHFAKEASGWAGQAASGILSGGMSMLSPLAPLLTIGGGLVAASAFNETHKANKYRQASKAVRNFYEHQNAEQPQAELEPVLRKKKDPVQLPAAEPKLAALGERLKGKLSGGPAR